MLILHDPSTLLHSTVELLGARLIPALESPDRITAIVSAISTSRQQLLSVNFSLPKSDGSTLAQDASSLIPLISATHSSAYLTHLSSIFQTWLNAELVDASSSVLPECFPFPTGTSTSAKASEPKDIYARVGYYAFDMSSGITQSTHLSILASANLALEGVRLLTQTSSSSPSSILALTRPPGHHCDGARCGGYCYINNAAVAVTAYRNFSAPNALSSGPKPKIAILDLDFHHGNGTQSIFYDDPSVFYVSIHGEDEFPYYTGSASETGSGEGIGFNLNLPLKTDSPFSEYEKLLEIALQRTKEYNAEFLIVSLGFDTFELDPLGKFKIGTEDYETMARRTRKTLMDEGGIGKALIVLEGGYVIDKLGENLLSFLRGWEEG